MRNCDVLNSGDVGGDSGNPKVVERRGELRGNHTKGRLESSLKFRARVLREGQQKFWEGKKSLLN